MWSRLGRCALLAIVLAASLAWMPQARAQQSAPFPSNPLPSNAELNYLVEGEIDSEIADEAHLIFERFDLKPGESLPAESGAQILIAVSGSVTTTDDLGLTASLNAGDRLFAPAGTINELTAASDARILRARISTNAGESDFDGPPPAAILHEIEIFTARCDPNSVTIRPGDSLAITNSTDDKQVFTAQGIDLEVTIEPGETAEIALDNVPPGHWVANCGVRTGSNIPIGSITLIVESPLKSIGTRKQATEAEVIPGQTILLDAPLEDVELPASPTLYVAKITLAGKSNTDEQTFAGPTGIVSSSQPLSLLREGRLPASLPAASSVLLPADTTMTIENAAVTPTEFFVVGLTSEDQETASTNDSSDSNSDDERPTARDSDDTPISTLTPVATARATDDEPDSYLVFIPTAASVAELGFTLIGSEERPVYADSLVGAFMPNKTAAGWVTGQLFAYSDPNSSINVAITVDEFISVDAASTMMEEMTSQTLLWGTFATPPRPGNASNIAANVLDLTESRQTGTQVTGQFGRFLVTVLVLTPIYTNGMPIAADFWNLVSATQD